MLKAGGYEVTEDSRQADIVAAHSGGCYMLPQDIQFATVMFIDPTYWPKKSVLGRAFTKNKLDIAHTRRQFGTFFTIRKLVYGVGYALRQPKRAYRMYLAAAHNQLPILEAERVIIVRNQHDPWCTPTFHEVFTHPHATFISFPSEHDDIWEHPERYVRIIDVFQKASHTL